MRKGDSERLPGFPHGQTVAAPRLQWCEYGYGSASKSRGPRAMGDSCESGRLTFSSEKCVSLARVSEAFASTLPDCREAYRRKRPGYVIANEPPTSHLSRWWAKPSLAGGRPAPGLPRAWGDCGNLSPRMPSCGINRWLTLGEPQTFKVGCSLGGERPALAVSRETFF